ncbi:MAG: hypothetical protein IJA15_05995 [Clostridia bacterium]|nr:hypothetical protein [Clostridia bacterium]
MKKIGRGIILISLLILCGVGTAIIFLTIPDKRLDTKVFWIAWSFAVPWNLIAAVGLHIWTGHKDSENIVQMPIIYIVCAVAGVIYLGVGFIFMYLPIQKTTLLWIIEIVITALYLIVAMFAMYGADYITKNQKEIKRNVMALGMLKADIDACINLTADAELKKELERLSEKVRFSDPMTHEALEDIENDIRSAVITITTAISDNNVELAMSNVKKCFILVESRNNRLRLLK